MSDMVQIDLQSGLLVPIPDPRIVELQLHDSPDTIVLDAKEVASLMGDTSRPDDPVVHVSMRGSGFGGTS